MNFSRIIAKVSDFALLPLTYHFENKTQEEVFLPSTKNMQDAPINLDGLTPLVPDGDVVPLPPPTQSYSNSNAAPINERHLQRLIEQGYTKGAKKYCGVEFPSFFGYYNIQFTF